MAAPAATPQRPVVTRLVRAGRDRPYSPGALELTPARFLFRSVRSSPIWLVVRLWLGWQWLSAGWGKLTGPGYDNWVSHSAGLQGFIAAANADWAHRAQAFGHPQVAYPRRGLSGAGRGLSGSISLSGSGSES